MALFEDKEIEVKFCVADLARVEARLKEIGALLIQPRTHEYNLRFDTPTRELTRQRQVLRLRWDMNSRLTFKGPAEYDTGVAARKEYEFSVSNFEAAQKFIQALGYQVDIIYEKHRTSFQLDPFEITLDEMPFGKFVEIEGPDAEAIENCAQRLGLNWEVRVVESYMMIFDRFKRVLGLTFRDLTFANFDGMEFNLPDLGVTLADLPQNQTD